MPRARPEFVGGRNVAALMDTIAWCEGTDNNRQRTFDDGFDVLVGGGNFTSYAAHPNILVSLPRYGIKSTAAGRYQFLKRTWDEMASQLGLENFFPMAQDAACVRLLIRRKALEPIKAGNLELAVERCRKEWASLPGSPFGQRTEAFARVAEIYVMKGGAIGQAQ